VSINYTGLRRLEERQRVAQNLLELRHDSLAAVRAQRDDHSFLLATWNIRDFDSNKFGWGFREPEAFYYIAEIIDCFDLVAIQEVTQDLRPFDRLVGILGRNEWDYLLTDVTEGASGNQERMAYLYRRDKVWFRRVSGEIVLPQGQLIVPPDQVESPSEDDGSPDQPAPPHVGQQFARSPYLVTFQSGWFRFSLCTVHIYFGDDSGAQLQRRIQEIRSLMRFFADRQDKEVARATEAGSETGQEALVENYILLGDFNVVSPEHETMQALESEGFQVPDAIDGDAIADRDHFYDQIAVRVKDPRFKVTGGGIVPVFADVFTDAQEPTYRHLVPEAPPPRPGRAAPTPLQQYQDWRTWQMSDHSPLWVKVEADFADDYLQNLA
jgi:endonuclease/exonuclease/phosphatase family metal-dependent hydrolase